jgi:hypothetical protein
LLIQLRRRRSDAIGRPYRSSGALDKRFTWPIATQGRRFSDGNPN